MGLYQILQEGKLIMKRPFYITLCIFIALFALANKCDKWASNIPPVVSNDSYIPPALPTQPTRQANTNRESNTAETNVCDVCGNRFTGRGYSEIAHGEWRETEKPYQSFICSRTCGMQHTKNWEIKLQKLHGNTSSIRPTQGHATEVSEDFADEPCGLCGGSGMESNRYGDARVCVMCDGTGKRNN